MVEAAGADLTGRDLALVRAVLTGLSTRQVANLRGVPHPQVLADLRGVLRRLPTSPPPAVRRATPTVPLA